MKSASNHIIEAGNELSPGDVFPDIPFPLLRYPLKTYRPDEKVKREGKMQIFSADGQNKQGDIAHCAFSRQTVMLISHGCEVDKTTDSAEKRHLLVAPLEPVGNSMSDVMQQRIREGRQPNRLFLPSNDRLNADYCVDLRRILPIPAKYLFESKGKRLFGLSKLGQADLAVQLGVYFSGLAIYIQDVECPHCTKPLTLSDFLVSSDPEDTDYNF
jgi:hypothetical protein